jgi:hypothetical protein
LSRVEEDGTAAAFYIREREGRFRSTALTRGPWSHDTQHAGPPAALLGRAIERCPGGEDRRVARFTVEILRPVPIGTLDVEAEVIRPGRRVDLVAAALTHDGREICTARAWRIRTGPGTAPTVPPGDAALPGPTEGHPEPFFDTGAEIGYHTAMEVRFLSGAFREPGPAQAWMRMRYPLVEGEEPSPLSRVLTAADSGNGVSAEIDVREHLFINTDLTVSLGRYPRGEWVALDARTAIEPDGIGVAESRLHDEDGPVGRALQTLLVAPRT